MGLAILNKAKVFKEANDVYLALTGYSREDLEAGRITADSLQVPEKRQQYEVVGALLRDSGKMDPQPRTMPDPMIWRSWIAGCPR